MILLRFSEVYGARYRLDTKFEDKLAQLFLISPTKILFTDNLNLH